MRSAEGGRGVFCGGRGAAAVAARACVVGASQFERPRKEAAERFPRVGGKRVALEALPQPPSSALQTLLRWELGADKMALEAGKWRRPGWLAG